MSTKKEPIIGQEAICPDGLGRVMDFEEDFIQVTTYINDRSCKWGPHNVTLINPIHKYNRNYGYR